MTVYSVKFTQALRLSIAALTLLLVNVFALASRILVASPAC